MPTPKRLIDWAASPHPVLLALSTFVAAILAFTLLVCAVETPAILYQAF